MPQSVTRAEFASVLTAARAGADWAWETIYDELAPKILGYLRGLGAAEPEDVTGEVFFQLVRDVQRFEGDERAFRAWVFTIAHHRFLDERRRRSRRPVDPVADVAESGGTAGDVEEDALRELASERVRDLIAGLSTDQRAVLLLRILGELTVPQVARALGKRPGAVKALQRRGLEALKKEIGRRGVPI